MHGERVDGDDLDAVIEAAGRLLREAREERRPAVLEAMTYRYRGHSVADAGLAYRTKDEIADAPGARPDRARARAAARGGRRPRTSSTRSTTRPRSACRRRCEFALASPEPAVDGLAAGMHAAGSAEQFARMRPGSPFGEEELTFDAGLGR